MKLNDLNTKTTGNDRLKHIVGATHSHQANEFDVSMARCNPPQHFRPDPDHIDNLALNQDVDIAEATCGAPLIKAENKPSNKTRAATQLLSPEP